MKQLLIPIEGIDGAGKFTQQKRVAEYFQSLGFLVQTGKEPNDNDDSNSQLGQTIKKQLKGELKKTKNPIEFQRIYVLERAQDCICSIHPFFDDPKTADRNKVSVFERFCHSTIAYGMLTGKPIKFFIDLHKQVIGEHMIWPDLTIILDISAEEAMRRIEIRSKKRKEGKEFFEKIEFLKKIRENYLDISKHPFFKNKTVVINGERDEESIFEDIKHALALFVQ